MDEIKRNPFQKEEYDKYMYFIEMAAQYFPAYPNFDLVQSLIMPDFKLLLALIFDARSNQEKNSFSSSRLCYEIAVFATRNTDKDERVEFRRDLLRECAYQFKDILIDAMGKLQVYDDEVIECVTQEVAENAFIHDVLQLFLQEPWISHVSRKDLDLEVLCALIMTTDRYLKNDEDTLSLLRDIAAEANKHIMKSDKELFISLYLSDIFYEKADILSKFELNIKEYEQHESIEQTQVVANQIVDDQEQFTFKERKKKNRNKGKKLLPQLSQEIVVETGEKTTKNKRRIAELTRIEQLIASRNDFLVSLNPVTEGIGIKRIVVKSSFKDIVDYLELYLPESATIKMELGKAKVIFGKYVENKEKPQYKRVSR